MKFEVEDRGNKIKWARITSPYTFGDVSSVARWCNECGCGKQVNVHTFSFKNEEELSMFLLRWQE